ncbi:MAG: hypothetical protein KAI73_09140 [Rhodospirillaceae bacterium]|nr:hypothetical protein [Rhodospirillaceae bacterium]
MKKYAVYEVTTKPLKGGGTRPHLNEIDTVEGVDHDDARTRAAEKTGRDYSDIRVAPC